MRVNWDTQSTSPPISFTLAFHIVPELSLNTRIVRLKLVSHTETTSYTDHSLHLLRKNIDVGGRVVYTQPQLAQLLHRKQIGCEYRPIPMPTRTIKPREICDTVSPSTTSDMFVCVTSWENQINLRRAHLTLTQRELAG
jgi:hypothetical protein